MTSRIHLCPKCNKPPALHNPIDGSCWAYNPEDMSGQEAFAEMMKLMAPHVDEIVRTIEAHGDTSLYGVAGDLFVAMALGGATLEEIARYSKWFMIGWACALKFGDKQK